MVSCGCRDCVEVLLVEHLARDIELQNLNSEP